MTLRTWRLALVVLVVVVAAAIAATSATMPAAVNSNAAREGSSVAMQSRQSYEILMLVIGVFVPLLAWAGSGLLPRVAPFFIRIPKRTYWLAPERRAAAFDWLEVHSIVTAAGVAVFVLGLHLVNVQANRAQPPRFDPWSLRLFAAAWVAFILASAIAFHLHFSRVPKDTQEAR